MDRAQAELDALKRTEEDLKKGHQKLEEMVSRLDQEVVRGPCFFFWCVMLSLVVVISRIYVMFSTRLRSTGTSSC